MKGMSLRSFLEEGWPAHISSSHYVNDQTVSDLVATLDISGGAKYRRLFSVDVWTEKTWTRFLSPSFFVFFVSSW